MFGISRSIRMTSGSSRRAIATPSLPSAASPTTSMSSSRSKNVRRPVRTTAWSSTSRTRIGCWRAHGLTLQDRVGTAVRGTGTPSLLHARRRQEPGCVGAGPDANDWSVAMSSSGAVVLARSDRPGPRDRRARGDRPRSGRRSRWSGQRPRIEPDQAPPGVDVGQRGSRTTTSGADVSRAATAAATWPTEPTRARPGQGR